ncbi:MAG: hypothetical protein KIT31_33455 [Deltaproteobacteria bacterium]|nr:hypothetical protein [Deltaproteobacteria bacterium]
MGPSLLLVEREHALRFAIRRFFEARRVAVEVCTPADAAAFAEHRFDAVILDYCRDDDTAARALVAACRAVNPATVVVLLADGEVADFPADAVRKKPLPLDELARVLGIGVEVGA